MINLLGDRFTVERDRYQWILLEWREHKGKDGEPKRSSRASYHATLQQAIGKVIDEAAGDCEDLESLKELLTECRDSVVGRASDPC